MPSEYEILGQAPGPLPGLDLSPAQVAGQAPIAPVVAAVAPAPVVAAPVAPVAGSLRAPERDDKGDQQFFPVRAADGSASVVDALGRTLVVKKLTIVQRMRLFKICGPDGSRNPAYFGYSVTAAAVQTINGAPLPNFSNEAGLERVVADLGDEGIEAAGSALSLLMKAEAGADRDAVLGAAKN